jgi:Spy/CpxP family protein refolding chaperone
MNVDKRLENLTITLNLSEKQQAKVKAILVEQKEKVDSIDAEDRTSRRAEMQKIMTETNSKILPILNEEQKKIYLEKIEKQMKNRGSNGQKKNLN